MMEHTRRFDHDGLKSRSPYNFVSLPAQWRTAGEEQRAAPRSSFDPNRYSGCVDLGIAALTPIYVRGTRTQAEYAEEMSKAKPVSQPEFFQPAERARIPGSTLRGLIRSLVEIVSSSPVDDVTKEAFHYRTFHGSRLSADYTALTRNVRGGYIERDAEGNLRLIPAKRNHNGADVFRIVRSKRERWTRERIWFRPPTSRSRGYPKVRQYVPYKPQCPGPGWVEGWLIASGDVEGKRWDWIVGPPGENSEQLSPETVRTYEDEGLTEDVRAHSFSVIPDRKGERIPCFFKRWGEGPRAGTIRFGHTGMFRLPYLNTPGGRFELREGDHGLAETIFGMASTQRGDSGADDTGGDGHAGAVRFEDAFLCEESWASSHPDEEWQLPAATPKVLGSPKATCFPHYACQNQVRVKKGGSPEREADGSPKVRTDDLQHWDSPNATPRGFKQYWHRNPRTWAEEDQAAAADKVHSDPIALAQAGTVYRGRVRFDNLTKAQLGALLFALQLPDGLAHKLGMGKPLGLGSVRLECGLTLIHREGRYTALFDQDGKWQTEERAATAEIPAFEQSFAAWALDQADDGNSVGGLWETHRMQELRALLNYDVRPNDRDTDYPSGPGSSRNEFAYRRVLPSPLDVAGSAGVPPANPTAQKARAGVPGWELTLAEAVPLARAALDATPELT